MRNDQGISIILSDSDDEVKHLIKQLGVTDAFPLTMLSKVCVTHPDAVYYEILESEEQLLRLSENFKIRRGILSVNGKRQYLGFNVDWMAKTLVTRDLEKAIEASIPSLMTTPSLMRPTPVLVVSNDEDREDPYEALGYSRR